MTVFRSLVWLSALWVGVVWGQIYQWTDRDGVVHLTDNASRIPPQYQGKVEVHQGAPHEPPAPAPLGDDAAQVPASEAAPSDTVSASPSQQDRLGRSSDYWRKLAQQWSTEVQQRAREREGLQLLYKHTRTLADSTRDLRERQRLQAELVRLAKAIAEMDGRIRQAQTILQTTLPAEAKRLGADPEWLKEPPEASR